MPRVQADVRLLGEARDGPRLSSAPESSCSLGVRSVRHVPKSLCEERAPVSVPWWPGEMQIHRHRPGQVWFLQKPPRGCWRG